MMKATFPKNRDAIASGRIAVRLPEAHRLTGVPTSTLRRLAAQGAIPAEKLGRNWLLPVWMLREKFGAPGSR